MITKHSGARLKHYGMIPQHNGQIHQKARNERLPKVSGGKHCGNNRNAINFNSMNFLYLASLGFAIIISLFLMPDQAEATSFNKIISITLSESCKITDCYDEASLIIHDTSNQKISGKLTAEGDHIKRSKPMPNHMNWYFSNMPGKTIIFVEPDHTALVRSKSIIIVPSLSEYAPPTNLTKSYISWDKTKTVTYQGVYVDPKCDTATVGAKQKPDIKGIIEHLTSDCTTDLKNKKETITTKTKLNYCGQECQHQKFMKAAKDIAKQKLIKAGKA